MSDPYLGEIRMAGFNFAPYGWALCQGQLLPPSQNQALFTLLGTTFGGNGQSTFGLPDLQGRSPVGWGQGLGLSNVDIGEQGGVENLTVLTSQMPPHTHVAAVTQSGTSATASVVIPATTSSTGTTGTPGNTSIFGPAAASGHVATLYSPGPATTTMAPFNASVSGINIGVQNAATGGGMPLEIRNPYLGITCIIALQGIFPTRS